jgi:hypothetical protein
MKPSDYARAAGVGAAVLILDVLLAFTVVYAWGTLFEPGRDTDYYLAAAIPIARLCSRIIGTTLMCAAAAICAYRKPTRNAYAFALAMVCFYAFFDAASAAFQQAFTLSFGLTMLIKLLAALGGAWLGPRIRRARGADGVA